MTTRAECLADQFGKGAGWGWTDDDSVGELLAILEAEAKATDIGMLCLYEFPDTSAILVSRLTWRLETEEFWENSIESIDCLMGMTPLHDNDLLSLKRASKWAKERLLWLRALHRNDPSWNRSAIKHVPIYTEAHDEESISEWYAEEDSERPYNVGCTCGWTDVLTVIGYDKESTYIAHLQKELAKSRDREQMITYKRARWPFRFSSGPLGQTHRSRGGDMEDEKQ